MLGQKCIGRANEIRKIGKVNNVRIGADIILDTKTIKIIAGIIRRLKPKRYSIYLNLFPSDYNFS